MLPRGCGGDIRLDDSKLPLPYTIDPSVSTVTFAGSPQTGLARSDWTTEAVRAVIAQQAGRSLRRAAADAVIYNENLTLAELSLDVRVLWQRWTGFDAR